MGISINEKDFYNLAFVIMRRLTSDSYRFGKLKEVAQFLCHQASCDPDGRMSCEGSIRISFTNKQEGVFGTPLIFFLWRHFDLKYP